MPDPMADNGSTLCQRCGLCCRGAFYLKTTLDKVEDQATLEALSPEAFTTGDDGSLVMKQPCAAHRGVCTIYESRPRACRRYQCDLLQDLLLEKATLQQCLDTVDEMMALHARLIREFADLLPAEEAKSPSWLLRKVTEGLGDQDFTHLLRQHPRLFLLYQSFVALGKKFYSGRYREADCTPLNTS